jgi:hypothetical protein
MVGTGPPGGIKSPAQAFFGPVHRSDGPAYRIPSGSHRTIRRGGPARARCLRGLNVFARLTTIDLSRGKPMTVEHGFDRSLMTADKSSRL